MACRPPGSSVHGIFQARIPPGDLPNPGIKPESPASPAFAGMFFTTEPPGKPFKSLFILNAGEGVEKRELSYTNGGNVNWYSHYGKQYGPASKN